MKQRPIVSQQDLSEKMQFGISQRATIEKPKACAIATSLAEAELLLALPNLDAPILSLAPDATVRLQEAGHKVVELEDVTAAFTHGRNVLRAKQYLDDVDRKLRALGWHTSEVEGVRILLFNLVPPLLLLQKALTACEEDDLTIAIEGDVLTGQSQKDVFLKFSALLSRSFDAFLPSTEYGRFHARLCKLANHLILKLLGKRPTVFQLDRATPFTKRVCNTLADSDPGAAIVSVRPPGKTTFASLRRTLKSLLAARAIGSRQTEIRLFRAYSGPSEPHLTTIDLPSLVDDDMLVDQTIREAIARYLPHICKDSQAGSELARQAQPSCLVLDHLIQPSVIRAAIDMTSSGARSIMINHGSDTAQTGRLANLGAQLWARHGRVNMPGLDTLICKGPLTAPLANEVIDNSPVIGAISIGQRYPVAQKQNDEFLVVMAGNYRELHGHIPYVTETPGEYLRGLLEFARAAAQVNNLRLLIKLKPKKAGLPFGWLQETLRADEFSGSVEIDTTTPFAELFERMDLLVGNNSATLQEALDNGIPLFLNTWRRRYCHFPAQTTPPTSDQRAPVYAVRHADELVPMLTAIRDRHQERLTGGETKGLSWQPDDIERTNEFLARALDPARR